MDEEIEQRREREIRSRTPIAIGGSWEEGVRSPESEVGSRESDPDSHRGGVGSQIMLKH